MNKKIGTYRGLEYKILQVPTIGHYVAYVRLPDNHPYSGKHDYDDYSIDVHGGLTFMQIIEKNDDRGWQGFTNGTWIGWDYAHFGDALPLMHKLENSALQKLGGRIWTIDEIYMDVKNVIRQVLNLV